jgi:hypothetical protein
MITAAAILGKDGTIYTGRRHCEIIRDSPKGMCKGCIQGFVDDRGNFLDRRESARHALKCKQIKQLRFNRFELFSEELW